VLSSSLLIVLVAAEGLWHLGSLFYQGRQYSQRGWFTNLLLCDIPRNKAPFTGPCHIQCTYTLCPFFGREKNTDGSAAGLMILLASVCYGDSRVAKHFLRPNLVFQPIWRWGRSWLFPASSIKFLTKRNLKSRWVYLVPHEDNSIQLLSTVRSRRWKNNFMVHLKVRWLIK